MLNYTGESLSRYLSQGCKSKKIENKKAADKGSLFQKNLYDYNLGFPSLLLRLLYTK